VNLADYRISFADGRPLDRLGDDTAGVVAEIAQADAVLLASPVYRASFTGVLKNLLDLAPIEALRNKPVGIVAMGATLHHYLGVDWHLRAVLGWFGALVAPTSVYLESAHFKDGKLADPAARAALADLVAGLFAMTALARETLGPPPLASGRP
jgi:FMN reductase